MNTSVHTVVFWMVMLCCANAEAITETQKKQINDRLFDGGSFFTGKALLSERDEKDNNELVNVFGVQVIRAAKNGRVGIGGFLGTDKDTEYVVAGLAASGRMKDSNHPINIGIGFAVDRKGPDRSGLVIMLSVNPVASLSPLLPDKVKKLLLPTD